MRPVLATSRRRAPPTRPPARLALTAAAALLALTMLSGFRAPLINDVATDLVDPPAFLAAPGIGRLPRSFNPKIADGYPGLTSLVLPSTPPAAAAAAASRAAARMPRWAITAATADRLEGTATTLVCRFVDDFTFRLRPENGGTRLDGRSRSRVGKGDFGANAARIQAFFKLVEEEVGAPMIILRTGW